MRAQLGRSALTDAKAAVAEATATMTERPHMVFAFWSTAQDPQAIASALAARFPGTPVVGCSTAGEILDGQRRTGTLSVSAVYGAEAQWAVERLNLAAADAASAKAVANRLFAKLGVDRETLDTHKYVALLLIDGLAGREEDVVAELAAALEGVPLVGGSAGDDLAFKRTHLLHEGQAHSGIAVVVMIHAPGGYDIFKHQHFVRTGRALVVTKVDPKQRRILELDGRPAAQAYAEAIGVRRDQLDGATAFGHPITFATHGEIYVRSVQTVNADDSLSFYCAVEEGMVVEIGGREAMVDALDRAIDVHLREHPRAALFLGFNCILRALEMSKAGTEREVACAWQRMADASIGFDTYGEQLNGLHINQTLVGVGLRA